MLLAPVLPYPDPHRRRRARRLARQLIDCEPWPGNDATPAQIAMLALLRLLWLQREMHRASRHKADLLGFIARAAVETCITGLYWLHGDTHIGRARSQNAKSFRRLMHPLADGDPISPDLIDDVAESIGTGPQPPSLLAMAEAFRAASGRMVAEDLYHRLYVPLSTLLAHPSGMALLRHVDPDQALTETPTRVWTRRAALHTVDACMGILALEIAEAADRHSIVLSDYAEAHMKRTIAPTATMLIGAALRNLRRAHVGIMLRQVLDLRRYYRSGRAASDSYAERKTKTTRAIAVLLKTFGGQDLAGADLIIQHFAEELANSVENEPTFAEGGEAEPNASSRPPD